MITLRDLKELIRFVSENYIICEYQEGNSNFIELLLKDDVIVDKE